MIWLMYNLFKFSMPFKISIAFKFSMPFKIGMAFKFSIPFKFNMPINLFISQIKQSFWEKIQSFLWFANPLVNLFVISLLIFLTSQIFTIIYKVISKKSNILKFIMKIIAAPGIIIHELSHLFICIILGVKVEKFKLFEAEGSSLGGYVKFNSKKQKGPFIYFFISFFPVLINASIIQYYYDIYYIIPYNSFLIYIWAWIYISAFVSGGSSWNDIAAFLYKGFEKGILVLQDLLLTIISLIIYTLLGASISELISVPSIIHILNIAAIYAILLLLLKLAINLIDYSKRVKALNKHMTSSMETNILTIKDKNKLKNAPDYILKLINSKRNERNFTEMPEFNYEDIKLDNIFDETL
ncbi:MAG: hypothetical protein ACTSRZ_13990 [Promethearchaeota archaeon]